MPIDKAARNRQNAPSRARYEAKAYKKITFRIRRDGGSGFTEDQIQAAAAAEGQSINSWIIDAIKEKI
jgi:predicted HicB family RNase H-like nuclease